MFEVEAKCGHVGRGWYVIKSFAVEADSQKAAARIARDIPRVKHHHPDAIRQVTEIDADRFQEIRIRNNNDPYFFCHSIQDQRAYCQELILFPEIPATVGKRNHKEENDGSVFYWRKQRIRHPKKYINNYCYEEGFAS